ncbi:MAG TPA: hypothetical protein VHH33_07545 [Nitrososphaeraceae archaeon]|jgi:hypothetical protein|nr:hypothetical protein [Nitrososphaeraceae archaeon]
MIFDSRFLLLLSHSIDITGKDPTPEAGHIIYTDAYDSVFCLDEADVIKQLEQLF